MPLQPHAAELRHLERQIILARPIFLLLAGMDLLVFRPGALTAWMGIFFAAYGFLALALAGKELWAPRARQALPLAVDLAFLAVFLILTPSLVAFFYLFLFFAFAAGMRLGMSMAVVLLGAVTLGVLIRTALISPFHWMDLFLWVVFSAGTFAAVAGIAFLGSRQRRQAAEHEFLSRIATSLRVDVGLAESVRRLLDELAGIFSCEQALLVFHDHELARIFLWKVRRGEQGKLAPENLPATRLDSFYLDLPNASICWNSLESAAAGFAWDRCTGDQLAEVPRLPGATREEFGIRSLLSAAMEFSGQPDVRLLLLNGAGPFRVDDLRWLERIARHMGPALENLFRLRYLRARTVEAERGRISHDLHDGILQTLLGLNLQLEVLRRRIAEVQPEPADELARIQNTLRQESQELRRMVNDLRPLRVASADLLEMMRNFGERFHAESAISLELLTEAMGAEVSDRVCREIFQIYREALHNIKKHAGATHVVVKLWQDEAKVCLMVDDNGKGFSFAGRFTSDELDRLRLGPISIKERTRSVGGVLTVESNPGHGARITVEVPFS
jgi:signal transduction histidine kinase